jgi:hypothetical protein
MALHLYGLCSWVERAVNAYDHNETDKLREALGRAYELVVRIRDENKE